MREATRNAIIAAAVSLASGAAIYMVGTVRDTVNNLPLMQKDISALISKTDDHEVRIRSLEHVRR